MACEDVDYAFSPLNIAVTSRMLESNSNTTYLSCRVEFGGRCMSSVVHLSFVVDRSKLYCSDVDEWCPLETQTGEYRQL
jgi:hypothetical protein